jgi:hypothetical protein
MILMGFIPGPREPKDLDSFLFPLVQEFNALGKGIPDGFNAARRDTVESTFLLRAYIVCIGADMIGRAKVRKIFYLGVFKVNWLDRLTYLVLADEYSWQSRLLLL